MTEPDALPPEGAPDSPGQALVGSVLAGRYRIVRHLGEGAMGSVYLGEHLRFGRMDAIKVLRAGMARDREATERFQRGARNASAINHTNVCTVYDFSDTDDGHQFLAMEYVEGTTLADLLESEGRLPLERSVEIVAQTASALDAAHHLGIVHRDLKPGNIMIARTRDGGDLVKVVDFDIAKGTAEGEGAEVTRTGFVVGTPEYMSPEQLIGDPLDGRSDTYSLALVFVRILTGRLPVRATSTQDLMVERLTQDPLTLAELAPELALPAAVQNALGHGLQRRREDRPLSAGEFAAGLRRALTGASPEQPGVAPPRSAPSRAPASANAVPATQVGASPRTGAAPATAPRGSIARWLPWALAGTAVATVALVFALSRNPAPGTPPPDAEPPTTVGGAAADPTSQPPPAAVDDPPPDPSGSATDPVRPPADPVRTDPVPTDPVRSDPAIVDPPARDPPTATTTPPTLSAAEAEDMLFRQLGHLSTTPGAATFALAQDSARQVWDQTTLPASTRALAAFVTGSALDGAGRVDEARPWARRAVELAPLNEGYQALLAKVGGRP